MKTKTPPSHSDRRALDHSPARTLGWAAFLGASWTWVIGMYLPVLLVNEFGLWGWIIFALPNVIGAAAMGAVLLTAERSRKLLSQHALMATAFSIVTIAFHVYFVGWMLVRFFDVDAATFTFAAAGLLFLIGGRRRDVWLAVLVLLASAVCMGAVLTQPLRHAWLIQTADPQPELLALAPICMFGFFLCPYLDLTFHRARQATEPKAGIRAFQIGFGVFFLLMIVFTLLYARFVAVDTGWPGVNRRLMQWALGVHLVFQIAFTLAVHARAVLGGSGRTGATAVWLIVAAVLATGLAAFAHRQTIAGQSYHWLGEYPLDIGEVIYRCFMGFYGLIFPAYVWLCMVPKGDATAPDRGKWLRFAIAVLAALPFFWLGFVERRYWWLLVGLGIVLAMRWFVPKYPMTKPQ